MSWVARVFPIARWLPTYQANWIAPDVLAGVTVWALVLPEAGLRRQSGRPAKGRRR
jgi:MFS superfamily sulfate permease-like transporter